MLKFDTIELVSEKELIDILFGGIEEKLVGDDEIQMVREGNSLVFYKKDSVSEQLMSAGRIMMIGGIIKTEQFVDDRLVEKISTAINSL
jgi:uncharacterized cupin superfamily protein